MVSKKMSIREKLELMKEIDSRNEEHRKEFLKKQEQNEKLFEQFERGEISEEQFLKHFKK